MKNSGARIWRGAARDTRAQEIVESALVLPLLFMILIGIFWFGQAFRIYGTLTHAAREGARAAVAPACTTCAPISAAQSVQNAQNAFLNDLVAENLNQNQLVPLTSWTPPTQCQCQSSGTTCNTPVTTCAGGATSVCVQPNIQLSFPNIQGGMGTCGTSVSARYKLPYAFRIPGTNLDLNNILLPGQAQMRVETQ